MNRITSLTLLTALVGAAVLSTGCATQFTPQLPKNVVHFTSEPQGAVISHQTTFHGVRTCKANCDFNVPDVFSWGSVYEFTATLPGYAPLTYWVQERTIFDGGLIVPKNIHFDMVKRTTRAWGENTHADLPFNEETSGTND